MYDLSYSLFDTMFLVLDEVLEVENSIITNYFSKKKSAHIYTFYVKIKKYKI